ncbi:MAG: bifunctional diguanylate cyclase/phosphodiesterase [Pseudomonadota bacterium]
MPEPTIPLRLTTRALALLPAATLSLVASAIALVIIASENLSLFAIASLLTSAILIYVATVFFLSRNSLATAQELEALGRIDPLSKLPNRDALREDIKRHLEGGHEVALAMLDLDGFKQINDHFGHAEGDELIRQCADLLRDLTGKEAACYRLGGDEFAAVTIGPLAGTILEGLSRKLLGRLESPVRISQRDLAIGASIGLANSTADVRIAASELIRRADVAMYMSKRGGKMRCTWFNTSFDERREAVRDLEESLRSGLTNNEFALAYQPLVDAEHGHIVAVEALLRWHRSDGEEISPNVFIPVAEESGLINPIGLWVLRDAMTKARNWDGIALSVNISAAQLRNSEFAIKLGEILEETGYPPHMLELEVTETCLVLDPVVAERSLDVIRKFGIKISLDDFGTGYASIGFLRQFRFEKLKLDRSLVVQASRDEGSRAMMLSSIAVARALDMGVTAEGVETEAQANMVRMAGCDQIQGWLYYKAMSACEIDTLVKNQKQRSNLGTTSLTEEAPARSAKLGTAQ